MAGDEIEDRKTTEDDPEGQDGGEGIDKQGLKEELADELAAERAQHFTYSDLSGPFDRASGCEVDVIDPGDDDDENRDDEQEINPITVPVHLCFRHIVRVKMDIGKGLEVDDHSIMCLLHIRTPFVLYHASNLLFKLYGVGAGAYADIIEKPVPEPYGIDVGAPVVNEIGPGDQDIEFQVRIRGWVGDHSRHFVGIRLVQENRF